MCPWEPIITHIYSSSEMAVPVTRNTANLIDTILTYFGLESF